MPISPENVAKLDEVVLKLAQSGADDATIQRLVADFKSKYDTPGAEATAGMLPPDTADTPAAEEEYRGYSEDFGAARGAELRQNAIEHPFATTATIGAGLLGSPLASKLPGMLRPAADIAARVAHSPIVAGGLGAAEGYRRNGVLGAIEGGLMGVGMNRGMKKILGGWGNRVSKADQLGANTPEAVAARASAAGGSSGEAALGGRPAQPRQPGPPAQAGAGIRTPPVSAGEELGVFDEASMAARQRAAEAPVGPRPTQVDSNNRPPMGRPAPTPTKPDVMTGPAPGTQDSKLSKLRVPAKPVKDTPTKPVDPQGPRNQSKSARNDPQGYSPNDKSAFDKVSKAHPEYTSSQVHEEVVRLRGLRKVTNYADKKAEAEIKKAQPKMPGKFERNANQQASDKSFEELMDKVHGPDWRPYGNGGQKGK